MGADWRRRIVTDDAGPSNQGRDIVPPAVNFSLVGSPITFKGAPKFMRSNICATSSAVAGIVLALSFGSAYSADRKPVDTQADLPRFSYPVNGKVETLLDADEATFAAFAAPVEADIDGVLRDYDIRDHAALRDLLQAKLNLQIISGKADGKTIEDLHHLRALEDKPSARLIAHLDQEAPDDGTAVVHRLRTVPGRIRGVLQRCGRSSSLGNGRD